MAFNDLRNASNRVFTNIEGELAREYVWIGVGAYTITAPVALSVSQSGHYILDRTGEMHFIPSGWHVLRWWVCDDQPHIWV